MDRETYLQSLSRSQLEYILNNIFEHEFEPLGADAPIEFWGWDNGKCGFFWTATGENILDH